MTVVAAFGMTSKKKDLRRVDAKKIISFNKVQHDDYAKERSHDLFTDPQY